MARTGTVEPRIQVTLQVPQTLYRAIERLTQPGERASFILSAVESDEQVQKQMAAIEKEEELRAKYEEIGRKAVEDGQLALDS